jgi:hypothetical protein
MHQSHTDILFQQTQCLQNEDMMTSQTTKTLHHFEVKKKKKKLFLYGIHFRVKPIL